jgi:hypothetical protein
MTHVCDIERSVRIVIDIKILFVSALDAVPELVSILPDVKTAKYIIKKPVALDDKCCKECSRSPHHDRSSSELL